ncbi:MAG: ABC transporter ATP-binding protein [Vagococcus fluvialis]
MIKVNNVFKSYYTNERTGLTSFFSPKKEHKVINNLNMEIHKGQIVGLLGNNGAGKTTTIKMLTTMLSPDSGKILIDDEDMESESKNIKNKINLIVGGERNLYWRLTGRENLEYFGSLYGIPKEKLSNKIKEILNVVDLSEAADTPVENYSKGMKQRLQIAKGLINEPSYLFLDEPTLGLDVFIAKELRSYIKKLKTEKNVGILLTSHYINEIEELCDYVYILDKGTILAQGSVDEIKKLFSINIKVEIVVERKSEDFILKLGELDNIIDIEVFNENNTILLTSKKSILHEIFRLSENDVNTVINEVKIISSTLEDALFNALGDKNEKFKS